MKELRFVVSLPNENSYHLEQANTAMEAARQVGAEVQILTADDDALLQSQQVSQVLQGPVEKRPNAILFEPLSSTRLVRVGEAAVAAGIGWVVLNSDVDYLPRLRALRKAPVFGVTRDHSEIGRLQAQQFGALLPQGGTVSLFARASDEFRCGAANGGGGNFQARQYQTQGAEEPVERGRCAKGGRGMAASLDIAIQRRRFDWLPIR